MRKSYLIWLALAIGTIVMAIIASAGEFIWYISISSLIMIFAPAAFLSLANFGLKELVGLFRAVFRSSEDKVVLSNAVLLFDSLKKYFLVSGIIGGFVGSIAMLGASNDARKIAYGAAMITLTILYGVIAYVFIAVPFAVAARKRLNEYEATH